MNKSYKILAFSDNHGYLPKINEKADFLFICGDICPVTNHNIEFQHNWVNGIFIPYLISCKEYVKNIVFIAGNHDFVFAKYGKKIFTSKLPNEIYYLENEDILIDDIKIWGSPYSNKFMNWAFMYDEDRLKVIFDSIPIDTDIVLCHGPAYGHQDMIATDFLNGRVQEHLGSKTLLHNIKRVQPKFLFTGHIHSGRDTAISYINKTMCKCVSYINESYEPYIINQINKMKILI